MPPFDDSLPLDEALDEESPYLVADDDDLDADEEMSGELVDVDPDDDESTLDDDDEDTDPDEEDEEELSPVSRQEYEQWQAEKRQLEYEQEQARYRAHWQNLINEAEYAFSWEEAEIEARQHDYVDPDAYSRAALKDLYARKASWYQRFYASIEQAKSTHREQALIPVYAARVATHYGLTAAQAKDLLNYPHDAMVREAKKHALHNKQIERLKKGKQQASRTAARTKVSGSVPVAGSGRPAKGIKAGSDAHLKKLLGLG